MSEPTGPLKGYRILDLTTVLFGPFGTQTLGDWGAEIIKIEGLNGDNWRYSGQFRNRGMSGQFMAANRNKRSLSLDLKHPDGKEVLRRLLPTADALVSNIRPAGLARLGFSYDECKSLNPKIVYATATGFGQDGPWRARPAFDEIIQAALRFRLFHGDGRRAGLRAEPDRRQDLRHGADLRRHGRPAPPRTHRRGAAGRGADAGDDRVLQQHRDVRRHGLRAVDRTFRLHTHEGTASGAHAGRLADDAALFRRELVRLLRSSRPPGLHRGIPGPRPPSPALRRSTRSTTACARSPSPARPPNGRSCCCVSTCRIRPSRSSPR